MNVKAATEDAVSTFIKSNNGWSLLEGKLHKEFIFLNFTEAFAFMTSIAKYAEESNHHPEWFNVYKRVEVDLITHEVSGISDRDFLMAKEMDSVTRKLSQ